MTRITSVSVNLGIFLVVLGSLLLLSLMGISQLDPIQSIPLVFAVFGVWLALISLVMPAPATSYAATRAMFLGWGGILTGLGMLWFSTYYGLFLIALAVLLIAAGVGAVGYALTRGKAKKTPPPVA